MAWMGITVVLAIVAAGAVTFAALAPPGRKAVPATVAAIAGLIWVADTLFMSFKTIESGHMGIVRAWGDCVRTMSPGVNVKAPWEQVTEANLRIQSRTIVMDGNEGRGAAISAETQPVFATVAINYALDPAHAEDLLCSEVGEAYYDAIIAPRVPQVLKSETVKYRTIAVAPNREQIRRNVQRELDSQLEPYGIDIADVLLVNLDFAAEFTKAIERKQVATQDALAAREKVQQAKAEADQAIESARGEAQAQLVRARAEATALELKGRALRRNPEVLRLTAIEKLNPTVQTIYVPPGGEFILPLPQSQADSGSP